MNRVIFFLTLLAFTTILDAQPLTGIKTIPGNYPNLQVAIDSLNAYGVGTGGVTFQVVAGQVFNLNANIYALKITATGTAANPIIFEKSGAGVNPLLQITGGSGNTDAGIWINGGDYITIDGIDITSMGTSSSNYLEYGVFINGTSTNGSSFNTLKNMRIRMSLSHGTAHGIYGLSTATTAAGRNSYNTVQDITIKNSVRGIWFEGTANQTDVGNSVHQVIVDSAGLQSTNAYGIHMYYQDSTQVTNCLISNIIGNYHYHIYMNTSKNFTIMGDTVRNISCTSTGTVYCIYAASCSGNNLIKGNVIHSATSSAGGINPIFRQIGSATTHITENHIYNITSTYTAGQVFGIIARDGTAIDYIFRNTVHNITSQGNLGAIGILFTSAASNVEYIYNNMVYDLKGPSTPSTYMIAGYYFLGGSVKFYYNTAYMNYTSASATNTSAALYVNPANGTTLDSRNNILVNTTNVTNGLRAAAFWWAGTSYSNIASTCNNNLLYAGTPGAKNPIFYDGVNSYQTLPSFKTAVTPRESASVTEMPPFISAVSPYNLHINPGITTQAESGGQQITTPVISNDIDNDVRWGHTGYIGNGTAPDIGADEFTILNTDCGLTGMIAPQDTFCSGLQPVTVVLKNYGPFPLSTVKVNWKVNNLSFPQYTWNGNIAINGTDTVTLGNFSFHHDTTYVVSAWTSQPNWGSDTATWNDSTAKSGFQIKAPPTLTLTSTIIDICQGDTATVTGTLTGTQPWSVIISDGTTAHTISNITSTNFLAYLTPVTTTTYTVLNITDAGGCPNTTQQPLQINVHPAPPAIISTSGSTTCCEGDSVNLLGSIGLNFSYQWRRDGVNIPNATSYVYAAKVSGAYSVIITSAVGCSSTSAPVTVIVNPSPPVFIGNDTTVAANAVLSLNAGAGFTGYQWSTGQLTQIINVDSSGTGLGTRTVWVRVTDNLGCKGSDTIRITFVTNPGIADLFNENLNNMFPNPTTGIVNIRHNGNNSANLNAVIYTTDGRLIYEMPLITNHTGETVLDISVLPASLYLIRLIFDNGSWNSARILKI